MTYHPASAKWRQWRADYNGTKPIVSIYAGQPRSRVKAYVDPNTIAQEAPKSSRFGKFFGRA